MKKLEPMLRLGTAAWAHIHPDDDSEVAHVTMRVEPHAHAQLSQRKLPDGRVNLTVRCKPWSENETTRGNTQTA